MWTIKICNDCKFLDVLIISRILNDIRLMLEGTKKKNAEPGNEQVNECSKELFQ